MKNVDNNSIIREDLNTITSNPLPWESLANKTVLITGGTGFIGAYLVKTLLHLNQLFDLRLIIVCVTRNKTSVKTRLNSCKGFPELVVFEQDMSLPLRPDFPTADIIIHAASQASPAYYSNDPIGTLSANIMGTINLLDFSRKRNIDQFLYISSGEVYGELVDANSEITENSYGYLDPTKVRSCYGESKRMSENICVSYSHQYGIDTRIVRPFHTYGPGLLPNDGRVFADFIHAASSGSDINMTSDGSARRPFCYISDAVTGIFHVLFNGKSSNAYNLANPDADISIKELAEIVSVIRSDVNININKSCQPASYLKSPISMQIVNIDKLKLLGWSPQISILAGFHRSISFEIE